MRQRKSQGRHLFPLSEASDPGHPDSDFLLRFKNEGLYVACKAESRIPIDSAPTSSYTGRNQEAQVRIAEDSLDLGEMKGCLRITSECVTLRIQDQQLKR